MLLAAEADFYNTQGRVFIITGWLWGSPPSVTLYNLQELLLREPWGGSRGAVWSPYEGVKVARVGAGMHRFSSRRH